MPFFKFNTFSCCSNLQQLKDLLKENLKWKMASYSSSNHKIRKVEGCTFTIINMSCHLEYLYGWGKAKRKHGLSRKNYIDKKPLNKAKTSGKEHGEVVKIHKKFHYKRLCSVAGCQSENKRILAHLQEVTFFKKCNDFRTAYML